MLASVSSRRRRGLRRCRGRRRHQVRHRHGGAGSPVTATRTMLAPQNHEDLPNTGPEVQRRHHEPSRRIASLRERHQLVESKGCREETQRTRERSNYDDEPSHDYPAPALDGNSTANRHAISSVNCRLHTVACNLERQHRQHQQRDRPVGSALVAGVPTRSRETGRAMTRPRSTTTAAHAEYHSGGSQVPTVARTQGRTCPVRVVGLGEGLCEGKSRASW